jgi:D-3-phosphoglycerate dehydrogenase
MAVIFFDFDSTIVKRETLDDAISTTLENHPNRSDLVREVEEITRLGMEGKLDFLDSVLRRLSVVSLSRDLLEARGYAMLNEITPGIPAVFKWIRENNHQIHIVSGGFWECIAPVAKALGVSDQNFHTNRFVYDSEGKVLSTDPTSLLWTNEGKTPVLRSLRSRFPDDRFIIVGDGMNDYRAYESQAADEFYGFGANVVRESVKSKAPHYFYSAPELLSFMQKELQ